MWYIAHVNSHTWANCMIDFFSSIVGALRGLLSNKLVALKGSCPNCGEQVSFNSSNDNNQLLFFLSFIYYHLAIWETWPCCCQVFAFVKTDKSIRAPHRAECHVCECPLEYRTKIEVCEIPAAAIFIPLCSVECIVVYIWILDLNLCYFGGNACRTVHFSLPGYSSVESAPSSCRITNLLSLFIPLCTEVSAALFSGTIDMQRWAQ